MIALRLKYFKNIDRNILKRWSIYAKSQGFYLGKLRQVQFHEHFDVTKQLGFVTSKCSFWIFVRMWREKTLSFWNVTIFQFKRIPNEWQFSLKFGTWHLRIYISWEPNFCGLSHDVHRGYYYYYIWDLVYITCKYIARN